MLEVGITGGIGSGKTTVCKVFEELGIPVYYADDRAKRLLEHDPHVVEQVQQLFGREIYDSRGKVDRKTIAARVFNDKELLTKLNAIVHPAVQEDYHRWVLAHRQKAPYVLKEAALLVEAGTYKQLDALICVTAPKELRIERIIQRDQATRDAVLARMQNQLPQPDKVKLSDYVIKNDGRHPLLPQVLNLHQLLKRKASEKARVSG